MLAALLFILSVILHVLMRTLPEPVLNLLQPQQPDAAPVPAPQQQPLLEPAQ